MTDTKGQRHHTLNTGDIDAIDGALAKIEFVRAAIVNDNDGDMFMNEDVADGAAEILAEALDAIREIVNQKDGTETAQPEEL